MKALDNRFYVKFMQLEIGLLSQVKIRVNEISFGSSILHNRTVYSTGCYDKCLKNGDDHKLF